MRAGGGAIDHAAERGGGESGDSDERVTRPALGRGPRGFRLEAGDEMHGPVHDALERVLAPQMVKGTDRKFTFDLRRTGTPTGAITLTGVVLVVARKQTLRIQTQAAGGRVAGDVLDIRFRANPADMAEPVRYTWACLGEEFSGGAEATIQVDAVIVPVVKT